MAGRQHMTLCVFPRSPCRSPRKQSFAVFAYPLLCTVQFQGGNLCGKHQANESILLAGTSPYSEIHFVMPMLCQDSA